MPQTFSFFKISVRIFKTELQIRIRLLLANFLSRNQKREDRAHTTKKNCDTAIHIQPLKIELNKIYFLELFS